MMTDDEIDRILAEHEPLVPSAGFATLVMSAVERAAAGPAPLSFPWWRAVPGLAALGGVLGAALIVGQVPALVALAVDALHSAPAQWIVLALTATVAAAQFAPRLVRTGV